MPSRADKMFLCALFSVGLGATNAGAQTETNRVALVALPAPLSEAIEVSIAAWEVEFVEVGEDTLGAVMPGTAEAARAVALRERVQSVVWISTAESGVAIWVYDGADDRVTARPLPGPPPYDDPTAAAIALTVKTLLRHSLVAPTTERFGATDVKVTPSPLPPRSDPRFGVGISLGARSRTALPAELRLGVGVDYRMGGAFIAHGRARVGVGRQISEADLRGRLGTSGFAVGVGLEAHIQPRLRLRAWAGPGVELARFTVAEPEQRTVARFNPTIDAEVAADLRLGERVAIEGHFGTAVLLRRQKYEVNGEPTIELPRAELEFGLGVRFWL